ncbi:hypothetical protein HK101_002258 [Irineochytrium annulatum]|nr:hypothetical protein HK101_002258 [Irineochytrium annulatum]
MRPAPEGFGSQLSDFPLPSATVPTTEVAPASTSNNSSARGSPAPAPGTPKANGGNWGGKTAQLRKEDFPPPASTSKPQLRKEDFPPPASSRPPGLSGPLTSGSSGNQGVTASTVANGKEAVIMARLQSLYNSDGNKFSEFKSLASSYRHGVISVDEFMTGYMALAVGDGARNKREAERDAFSIWTSLAETVPDEESVPPPANVKLSQKARKRGGMSGARRTEEMLRAMNDYKAKKSQEENIVPRPSPASYANSASRPGLTDISVGTAPAGPGLSPARVLVIKSSTKQQRIHAGSFSGKGYVSSRDLSPAQAANAVVDMRASFVGGSRPSATSAPRAADPEPEPEPEPARPFFTAAAVAPTPAAVNKGPPPSMRSKADFPGLPAAPARGAVKKAESNGAASWGAPTPEPASASSGGGGGGGRKKKGKEVLMHFG